MFLDLNDHELTSGEITYLLCAAPPQYCPILTVDMAPNKQVIKLLKKEAQ